jgi:hypothetical protein
VSASPRMSVAEFRKLKTGRAQVKGAKTTIENGWKFQSKLEARRYRYWLNMWQLRQIAWFTRQVPFYLPGGIIWRADFLVVMNCMVEEQVDGENPDNLVVEDCKGHLTEVSRNKIKQVEDIYGFKVQIIKKGDFR